MRVREEVGDNVITDSGDRLADEAVALLSPPGLDASLHYDHPGNALVGPDGTRFDVALGVPMLLPHEGLSALSETLEAESQWYDHADEYSDNVLDVSREALSGTAGVLAAEPRGRYIDALFEYSAQQEALEALGSLEGKIVAQVGGSGLHAVKMLMGGAAAALTVTPFFREALIANQLAAEFGVADGHVAVVGMGEALPLRSEAFDVLYLGGSLHHLNTGVAAQEMARVLRPGGVFAAVDPWKTAIYATGTRLFGKRERDVSCVPMNPLRVAAMEAAFESLTATRFHPVLRYPLILLDSRGPLKLSRRTVSRLLTAETRVESRLPRFTRGHGSCVAIVGRKSVSTG